VHAVFAARRSPAAQGRVPLPACENSPLVPREFRVIAPALTFFTALNENLDKRAFYAAF
jgi:hypothetical protein